jgi:hypothetical protein
LNAERGRCPEKLYIEPREVTTDEGSRQARIIIHSYFHIYNIILLILYKTKAHERIAIDGILNNITINNDRQNK